MTVYDDLRKIGENLKGAQVPRPSRQLSGHAGGLPFEELVHQELLKCFPGRAFRHYEALNYALMESYRKSSGTFNPKNYTFGSPGVNYLCRRGEKALKSWSPDNLFEEKQNDTAESIIFSDKNLNFDSNLISLIDVKSQNSSIDSQAPNIISANKIIKVAEIIIKNNLPVDFEILYMGVKFHVDKINNQELLIADNWTVVDLFRINPEDIYINLSAALQIQFHPFAADQSYTGTHKEWLKSFVKVYITSLEKRISKNQETIKELKKLI